MELHTKIGISIIAWLICAVFMSMENEDNKNGEYAIQLWSTVFSIAVLLILK